MAKGAGGVRTAGSQGPTVPVTPSGRPVRMPRLNVPRNIQVATGWRPSPANPQLLVNAWRNKVARIGMQRMSAGGTGYYVELFQDGVMQPRPQTVRTLEEAKRIGQKWLGGK